MLYEQMNRGPGLCPRVRRTKIGDTLMLVDDNESKTTPVPWKVVAVHKYFVVVENRHGTQRGVTFGDLRILGKE